MVTPLGVTECTGLVRSLGVGAATGEWMVGSTRPRSRGWKVEGRAPRRLVTDIISKSQYSVSTPDSDRTRSSALHLGLDSGRTARTTGGTVPGPLLTLL